MTREHPADVVRPNRGEVRCLRARLSSLTLAALLINVSPSSAQWGLHVLPDGFTMTDEDISRMRAARNQLLEIDSPAIGQSVTWSNPQSGARGSIKMEGLLQARGLPCRQLRFVIAVRGATSTVDIGQQICRMPDGTWKFL